MANRRDGIRLAPAPSPEDRHDLFTREQRLERLRAQVAAGRPVIGGGAGTGLSAKCAEAGGIDLIIVYNSGRFRMAGRGSLDPPAGTGENGGPRVIMILGESAPETPLTRGTRKEDRAMPTAISENIRSRQERLNASMQEAVETIGQALVDKGAAIIEAQREMEQELRTVLREGLEKEALLGTLAALRSGAEQEATWFARALALFEGDPTSAPAIEPQLREAKRFLAWLCDLEARVSAPAPPFDRSKLPPDQVAPTAEGYISISEARDRVRAGRKP